MEKEELKQLILKNEIIKKIVGSEFKIELIEDKINQVFKIHNSNKVIYAKVSRRGWSRYEWNSLNSLFKMGYYVPEPIDYTPVEIPVRKGWAFGDLVQENGVIYSYPVTGKSLLENYSLDNVKAILKLLHDFHGANIRPNSPIKNYQEAEVKRGLKYVEDLKLDGNLKLINTLKHYPNVSIDYGLIHGVARPEHFIFYDSKIGMIDLESSCIGDPFKDFGILLGELYFYGFKINLLDHSLINDLFGRKLSENEILRLNFFLIRRILVELKYEKTELSKKEIMQTLEKLYEYNDEIFNELKEKQVLILDSSAFLGGYNPNIISIKQYTIPEVFEEVKSQQIKSLMEFSVETGKLLQHSPAINYVEKISTASIDSGDEFVLSEVDKKILALALDLQENYGLIPTIITDDYSMQNIAKKLNINFKSVIEKGIKDLIKWKIYCPGCRKSFDSIPKTKICPDCGTSLKRFAFNKSKK